MTSKKYFEWTILGITLEVLNQTPNVATLIAVPLIVAT